MRLWEERSSGPRSAIKASIAGVMPQDMFIQVTDLLGSSANMQQMLDGIQQILDAMQQMLDAMQRMLDGMQ